MSSGQSRESSSGIRLVAAISGLLLTVAFLEGSFTPDGPKVGSATANQVRDFAADNTTALRLAALTGVCVLVLIVVFTAAIAQLVRLSAPASMLPSLIVAGGALVGVYVWLDAASQSMTVVLPELIDTDLAKMDDASVLGWYGLTSYTHYLGDLVMAPIALTVGAASIAVLRTRVLPRWQGWFGVLVTACGAIGLVGIATGTLLWAFWFGGLLGWVLWVPIVSVTLGLQWRHARRKAG